MTATAKTWGRRILAIALGILLIFALLEAGLQVAALLQARASRERLRAAAADGRPLVAFVGDSNIYGLYVDADQTIARNVERLSKAGGGRGVATVNLGYPGSPSWTVLEQARRALELKPVALVARAGINNYSSIPPDEGSGIFENLRIVKTARILLFNYRWDRLEQVQLNSGVGGEILDSEGRKVDENTAVLKAKLRDGGEELFELKRYKRSLEFAQIEPRLKKDLQQIVDLCDAAGTRCILAVYLAGAQPGFSDVRSLMLQFEGVRGARVADCARIPTQYAKKIASAPPASRPALASIAVASANGILLTKDSHPTAPGYAAEAAMVLQSLHLAGIATDSPDVEPLSQLPAVESQVPVLRQGRGTDGGLAFLYEGVAGDRVQVLFGVPPVPGTELSYNHTAMPIDVQSWRQGGVMPETSVVTAADGSGRARLQFPADMAASLRGASRAVAYVHRGGKGGAAQILLSEPIEFVK